MPSTLYIDEKSGYLLSSPPWHRSERTPWSPDSPHGWEGEVLLCPALLPPTLPVSAVSDQCDMFGPEEEERVAVSPGLVVVPAGWTESEERERWRD